MKANVALNLRTLSILLKYLDRDQAIAAAKELIIEEYEIRQQLKDTIIAQLRAVYEPQFTVPGAEKLSANTISRIDEMFDYQYIVNAYKKGEVEFLGFEEEK